MASLAVSCYDELESIDPPWDKTGRIVNIPYTVSESCGVCPYDSFHSNSYVCLVEVFPRRIDCITFEMPFFYRATLYLGCRTARTD